MKFSTAAAAAALASTASAGYYQPASNVTYVTDVVTAYTTYCPGATQIVHGTKTYTVTEATTLTITNCPCTITRPVYSTSAVPVKTTPVVLPPPVTTNKAVVGTTSTSAAAVPKYTTTTSAAAVIVSPGPYMNSTSAAAVPNTPAPSASVVRTTAATTSVAPIKTGGAASFAASGAGLAGAVGLAAFFL